MFGWNAMSRCIVTQNMDMIYRIITYNCYRITRDYVLIFNVFYRTIDTRKFCNAGGGIRTHELLKDRVLSPAPLTRLGNSRMHHDF